MSINKEVYLLQAIIVTNKTKNKKEETIVLQLQTKKIDICRISKLLVKYNIKASITNQVITLEGDISEELITKLCGNININSVQNYISEKTQFDVQEEMASSEKEEQIISESVEEPEEIEEPIQTEITEEPIQMEDVEESEKSEEIIQDETVEEVKSNKDNKEYDLIYPIVKRGQVYWCDLDFDSGVDEESGEDHKIRPVIIVGNDKMNMDEKCKYVKVVPCSTKAHSNYPWRYHFKFTREIMTEMVDDKLNTRFTNACGEQSKPVEKRRLREYIGTMTPEFMEKIQEIIDEVYALKREVKTIAKQEKTQFNRPVSKKIVVTQPSGKQIEESDAIRKQLLAFVDSNELHQILQSHFPSHTKAQRILELYGFDFEKNGVLYLLKAINISTKQSYFNLETLSTDVSRKVGVEKEEVMRLIVARVKERFGFKKAPTIEFIRLINSLLLNQEEEK